MISSAFRFGPLVLAVAVAVSPVDGNAQRLQPVAFAPTIMGSSAATNASAGASWKPAKTRKGNAWKGAKVGALVGMIALPTAIYIAESGCEDYCFTTLAMAVGIPVGAIGGAVVGAGLGALWWEPPKQAATR